MTWLRRKPKQAEQTGSLGDDLKAQVKRRQEQLARRIEALAAEAAIVRIHRQRDGE